MPCSRKHRRSTVKKPSRVRNSWSSFKKDKIRANTLQESVKTVLYHYQSVSQTSTFNALRTFLQPESNEPWDAMNYRKKILSKQCDFHKDIDSLRNHLSSESFSADSQLFILTLLEITPGSKLSLNTLIRDYSGSWWLWPFTEVCDDRCFQKITCNDQSHPSE